MNLFRCLLVTVLLCSCISQTQTEQGADYGGLVGTWRTQTDPSLVLTLSRVCCGSKSGLGGSLLWKASQANLESLSYAILYPIQKPDASTEYSFEIVLSPHLDPICAVDGFVQDGSGKSAFPQPVLPDSAVLALTLSSRTVRGCDSLWTTMLFERRP